MIVENRLRELVVVLTDVFEQLKPIRPPHVESARPSRCVRARIVDCYFILQRPEVGTRQALDQMKQEKILERWKRWSGDFISTEAFIETLYNDLTGKKSGEFIKHN